MIYKNATIIDPDGKRVADLEIVDGVIRRVGKIEEEGIDVKGAWVLPALIDMNVALYERKLSKEHLKQLASMARRGGVGAVCLRPDIQPPLNEEISLEFVAASKEAIDIFALLLATKEEGLSEIASLRPFAKGLFVYSDTNSYLLARIFEYAKMLDIPLFVGVRNQILRSSGVMNDGEIAFRMGLGGASKLEEYSEVAKVIEFSEFYGVAVIFQEISTARTLDLIAQSTRCYAEISLHHLLKSDEAANGYNTLAKLSPPLRDREEQEALLQRLHDGKVDFLTSLHSPMPYTTKDLSFDEASYGIDSIGFYLPLAFSLLVQKGILSLERLLELTSANQAAKLGLKRGFVKCGYEAKLLLFDPTSPCKGWGLYEEEELYGRVSWLDEL